MQKRSQILEAFKTKEFDLIIVGGGVVGAGVAQDAASRGLSVALVEKDDFASGTSSRTTKLIHGGLRYLEQFQFRLTRELCQERGLLEQLAPHMVRDFSFVLPVRKGKTFFGLKADIGLTLYDILSINAAGVRRHERLSKKAVLSAVPSLSPEGVQGALRFHDCITDDSRIVMEVLKSADKYGAHCLNYMEAVNFEGTEEHIAAVICKDRISGEEIRIKGKACVNAAGVWTDRLLKQIKSDWKDKVAPAKGTHIMLPLSCFETSTALFLPTDDGRYVFVVPWQKTLMVGTTDLAYEGPLENPKPTEEEIAYLISVLNSYSAHSNSNAASPGKRPVERKDVIASWAGLRPLVLAEGEETKNISREHLLFTGPMGIIGLIGGKLTNYRMLAIHLTDMVLDKLKARQADVPALPAKTGSIMLGGWEDKSDYLTSSAKVLSQARKLALDPASIEHIIATYGKDALKILQLVEEQPALVERICPDFPPIMAEVAFVVENELAECLVDILARRIRLAFLHHRQCIAAAPKVAKLVAKYKPGFDNDRIAKEIENLVGTLYENQALYAANIS